MELHFLKKQIHFWNHFILTEILQEYYKGLPNVLQSDSPIVDILPVALIIFIVIFSLPFYTDLDVFVLSPTIHK